MVLPLASRFAVLSVEDDDECVKKSTKNQNKKKQATDNKQLTNAHSKQQKQDPKKKTKKVENQVGFILKQYNFVSYLFFLLVVLCKLITH